MALIVGFSLDSSTWGQILNSREFHWFWRIQMCSWNAPKIWLGSPGILLGLTLGSALGLAWIHPWDHPWDHPNHHKIPNLSHSRFSNGYSPWIASPGPMETVKTRMSWTQIPDVIPAVLEPEGVQGIVIHTPPSQIPIIPLSLLKFLFFSGKPFLHSAPPGATSPWHSNSRPRLGILEEVWGGLVQFPPEFLLEFPVFQSPLTISSRRCRAAAPCIQKKIPWIPR